MVIDETESGRLRLATLDPDGDHSRYVDWLNDPEVNRYLESRHAVSTAESVRRYVEENNRDGQMVLFGVFEKETNAHIGNVRISAVSWLHGHAQIGLLIGEKDRWRKGYATEMIAAATTSAFEKLKLRKLLAGCYASNVGSMRAFLRCGYQQVGLLRAHWANGDRYDDEVLLDCLAPTASR
jgi:[ribosomal protein S5]-alanine N-acetyltransferase